MRGDKLHADLVAAGLLTALFVGLKLGGVLDWGWGLVLWPVWAWSAAWLAVFVAALIIIAGGRRG